MDEADIENLEVWAIADDADELEELKATLVPRKKKEWEPLFTSEDFFPPNHQP